MSEQPATITPEEERYWNRYRLVQTLQSIAALWAAMAIVALAMGAGGYRRALSQADWPSVPGTIVAAEVVTKTILSPGTRRAEVVRIVYDYRVGETAYTGDRVNLNPVPVEAGSDEGQRLLATYPPGAAVIVYHDPADPAQAILERQPSPLGFIAGLALLAMAGTAGVLAFALGRGLK